MSRGDVTFIGEVVSVTGSVVSVKLTEGPNSSLVLVDGESYRLGQVGAFLRIPLGYNHLYGVCTQVGASAAPQQIQEIGGVNTRWLSLTLFGEALGARFERGVSQYPTVGDEVHLVTTRDLEIIYGSLGQATPINVGIVSGSSGIPGQLDLDKLISRHCAIVGATGSGKSNTTTVLLESIADQGFPSARILIIDPHGEYVSAFGDKSKVFRVSLDKNDPNALLVPFWALPCDELFEIAFGGISQSAEAQIRDELAKRKELAATHLQNPPPAPALSADSPIPFNIKKLWFDLDDYERHTLQDRNLGTKAALIEAGNFEQLKSNAYPAPAPGNAAPYVGPRRGISRQLDLMRSRLRDSRFAFLFNPGDQYTPDVDGKIQCDLGDLVASWVGHDKPITVLDVSGSPSEVMGTVIGTVLKIVYDTLFWAGNLPVSGRKQPLLVVLDEAHLFLSEGQAGSAANIVQRIAKEGRKYGVGLLVVTQRPTEIDSTVLSQCGSMIALRMTSSADRGKVSGAMSDDLGNLSEIIPSLRTGEALVIGEAMPIPSRILFRKAVRKISGNDPEIGKSWRDNERPDAEHYKEAVRRWRNQSNN